MADNTSSINTLTKRSLLLRLVGLVCIIIAIVSLLVLTTSQLKKLNDAKNERSTIERQIVKLKATRDSIMLQYLEAKGFSLTEHEERLGQSIKADKLLADFKKSETIDSNLQVIYFRKTLDQEKIWLSIKELGYKKISENKTVNTFLLNGETNALIIGEQVPLTDVKFLALTLIRAGFQIQHIEYFKNKKGKEKSVQILREAPKQSADTTLPITVDKIKNAKDLKGLIN